MRRRAKSLRHLLTISERRLWNWLRNRSFSGYKFRRQVPIDNYVVDFFCAELKLVIEVDGRQHEMSDRDTQRTLRLRNLGIEVLRITNELLAKDSLHVEGMIREAIKKHARN